MGLSLLFITIILYPALRSAADTYNVVDYGAKADGGTDSGKSFLSAWAAACGTSGPSTINVSSGKYLIGSPVVFSGKDCKSTDITFRIDGTLVASDYRKVGDADYWLKFDSVDGVTISGGILDGQGASLWACKNSRGGCPTGATSLRFTKSSNVAIYGLTSANAKLFHIAIDGSNNVKIRGVKVSAPGGSPNTDGIHVEQSNRVLISSAQIATGDDCISVGQGTSNLWIENVSCGPGHGISIGSLGKQMEEQGVENVTVKTVAFSGTENGVRIKCWARPSHGFVKNVVFQHANMFNVQNPIIIDQNYCPHDQGCPNKASGIKISGITYQDIQGSSATQVAVKFDCSPKHPCTDISLQDIKLTYNNQPAQSSCAYADGSTNGAVNPASCLKQ
ncbi:hypothetical protein Nepgr_030418 [Nepenthes gracilis]|uniref:Polygalacturonase n=1 Tax=Nepenthes gracilis TaxID=150966 RepID=A0AAD3Y5R4_NEPGR|nr:hypothetical protein Nepgr_030418 [Nepenthes gracilis]